MAGALAFHDRKSFGKRGRMNKIAMTNLVVLSNDEPLEYWFQDLFELVLLVCGLHLAWGRS